MMISFDDFLRKQEEVYTRFRDTTFIREQGTQPPAYLSEDGSGHSYGAYAVVLRHSPEIVERIADLSTRLACLLPVIGYDHQNIHTTLLSTDLVPDFQPDDLILRNLAERVHRVRSTLVQPTIDYRENVFNRDSVIAAGYPDSPFVNAVNTVTAECSDFPLAVKSAWGSHITTARFLEEHSPAELDAFFAEMEKSAVPGVSTPIALDVGYFSVNRKGFFLETYDRLHFI